MISKTSKPRNTNNSPSMLEIFTGYLTETSTFHLMIHILYIGIICFIMSMSYVVAFHWDSLVELYHSESTTTKDHIFKQTIEQDNKITEILQKSMQNSDGMRAYLHRYQFVNLQDNNIPLLIQFNTNEVVAPGVERLIDVKQRIISNLHPLMNTAFIAGKCYFVSDTRANTSNEDYYSYQSSGAIGVIRCPIYTRDGDLAAFIGIDFNHTIHEDADTIAKIQAVGSSIGDIIFSK